MRSPQKTMAEQLVIGEAFAAPAKKDESPVAANGMTKAMNEVFAEWLRDHITENSRRGDAARTVRDKNIATDSPDFPRWREYETLQETKRYR